MLRYPKLTAEQVTHFRNNGFVLIPGAFSSSEASTIQQWAIELSEMPEETGKHWVYHESSLLVDSNVLINRIENMTPFHRGFFELADSLKFSVRKLR